MNYGKETHSEQPYPGRPYSERAPRGPPHEGRGKNPRPAYRGAVLADASVNLNGCFAIRGVKVVNGTNGPFVSMPSYRTRDGYKDVCFPCTKDFHQQFHQAVLDAYRQELSMTHQRHQETAGQDMAPPAPEMKM